MNFQTLFKTNDIPGYWIIRIVLGYVFLVAGFQKFIFPDDMGPGRFAEMGFPMPVFTAYFTGFFEVLCAVLILVGLASRLASVPLIIIMLTAIITTKIPGLGDGFWDFAHSVRLDFSMLMAALFVFVNGSDQSSLDKKLFGGKADDDENEPSGGL
ncbi:MAG: DoxX family protein [Balneolia bacterium]|nr:DoxX family protein [Balneolia bacterium]